jgi:hypothetical protein
VTSAADFGLNVPLLYYDVDPNDEKSLSRCADIGPTHLYWVSEVFTSLVESDSGVLHRYIPTSLPHLNSRAPDENRLFFGPDFPFPARWPDAYLYGDNVTNAIAFVGNPQRGQRYRYVISRLVRLCGAKKFRLRLF